MTIGVSPPPPRTERHADARRRRRPRSRRGPCTDPAPTTTRRRRRSMRSTSIPSSVDASPSGHSTRSSSCGAHGCSTSPAAPGSSPGWPRTSWGRAGRSWASTRPGPRSKSARRIDITSIVEWRNWEGSRLPFDDRSFDVVACQHALHRFNDPVAVLEDMRRVLAPGGRLGVMTWGPIEENPAFAAELDAIVKSGLDQSGVVEVLLDAFAYHRIDDLRELVHERRVHRRVVPHRPDVGGAARRGPVGPRVPVAAPAVLRPGGIAASRPASSSWPGPPSCCDPSSTRACCVCRPRRASSWPGHPLVEPPPHRNPGRRGVACAAWPTTRTEWTGHGPDRGAGRREPSAPGPAASASRRRAGVRTGARTAPAGRSSAAPTARPPGATRPCPGYAAPALRRAPGYPPPSGVPVPAGPTAATGLPAPAPGYLPVRTAAASWSARRRIRGLLPPARHRRPPRRRGRRHRPGRLTRRPAHAPTDETDRRGGGPGRGRRCVAAGVTLIVTSGSPKCGQADGPRGPAPGARRVEVDDRAEARSTTCRSSPPRARPRPPSAMPESLRASRSSRSAPTPSPCS